MPILQISSILAALIIGLIVVVRNSSDRNRWLLLLFNTSIALWIASYILADMEGGLGLIWNRAVFACALGIILCGYLLISSMANRLGRVALLPVVAFFGWVLIILLSPLIVEGIVARVGDEGTVQGFDVVRGEGYLLYVASLVLAGASVVGYVFRLSRHAAARFRVQLRILFAGMAGMLLTGLIIGIGLPLLFRTSEPANYTFLSAFIVMAAFIYAIVRQRLFDIRFAIARSLGYVFSLAAIVIFYVSVAFGIGDFLFGQEKGPVLQVYYVITALVVALTFNRLKIFFNQLTRWIFFRDTYDTQEVLDRLTSFLVRTVSLDDVLQGARKILKDATHVDFLEIVLKDQNDGKYSQLIETAKHVTGTTIVADELTHKGGKLVEELYHHNVALIARLQTQRELVGYIICGPKTRGDMLTVQDTDLMRIAGGELAVAVQNALRFKEILHFNETLKQEVEDATVQLRESNRKLKRLDEAKDEFISMASHQLRTPLTSVKGYISMVMDGDAGKLTAPQQKLLEEAFTAAQRMVYLIGDFLNVSRLQTGRFVLEVKPADLAQVVNDEVSQLASTAARRNIKVNYHHPVQFPILRIDENKMRQVIMNFIDNAIFYSRPSTSVEVTLVNTGKDIRFEVRDTGIGVPEAERHKLFTKFFRAENARRVRPDGTGIGLFMAKKVVTAHGGSILLETKEGKGSTFGFVLPIAGLKNHH